VIGHLGVNAPVRVWEHVFDQGNVSTIAQGHTSIEKHVEPNDAPVRKVNYYNFQEISVVTLYK